MSSSYKQQNQQAKQAKRGVAEQRPVSAKSSRKKQPRFNLMYRQNAKHSWKLWNTYVHEEDAWRVAYKWICSGLSWEWRVEPRN